MYKSQAAAIAAANTAKRKDVQPFGYYLAKISNSSGSIVGYDFGVKGMGLSSQTRMDGQCDNESLTANWIKNI